MSFYPFPGINKSEKKMKLTLKGGAAVDPDSGEQGGAALARIDQEVGWQQGPTLPSCLLPGSPSPSTHNPGGEPPKGGVRVAGPAWTFSLAHQPPRGAETVGPLPPATGLEHSAHVLEKGGKVFSATLGLVDIVKGTNSYYKLQLLEDDKESRCVLGTGVFAGAVLRDRCGPVCAALAASRNPRFPVPGGLVPSRRTGCNEASNERGGPPASLALAP